MTEQAPSSGAKVETDAARAAHEALDETKHESPEALVEHAETQGEAKTTPAENLQENPEAVTEKAEQKVEAAQPVKAEDLKQSLSESEQPAAVPAPTADKAQRDQASRTYLNQVRKHLRGVDVTFSEFIHNPTVDRLSETAGRTFVRPSGMLVGGIATLLGSAWYLYATNHTGFRYNFFFAFLLFVGGFILGLILEIIFKSFAKSKKP